MARAVARPGGQALRIAADNTGAGWIPIERAVEAGGAFAVEVADSIIAVDFDTAGAAAAADTFAAAIEAAGLRAVMVASGTPGRRHVFARVDRPALRAELAATAHELGGDVRNGGDVKKPIRPPLSPHRIGLPVELLSPATPEEARDLLRAPASTPSSGRPRRPLSAETVALLRHGDRDGLYPSRSEVEAAIAWGFVKAGWTLGEYRRAILDPRNSGGAKARSKRGAEADRYIARTWDRAVAFHPTRARDRGEAQEQIAEVVLAVDQGSWHGKAGATDLAVLLAHVDIARRSGKLAHGASVREVAELAGVAIGTVSASHKRLRAARWLAESTGRTARGAKSWRLQTPPAHATPPEHSEVNSFGRDPDCSGDVASFGQDAFRWRGLGKSKARVAAELGPEAVSAGVIAVRFGVTRRTIERHLACLAEYGLAERTEAGWKAGNVTPPEVAELVGTAGEGARQRERHRTHRAQYLAWREHRQAVARRQDEAPYTDPETGERFAVVATTGELVPYRPKAPPARESEPAGAAA